jgi:hypothetical protein
MLFLLVERGYMLQHLTFARNWLFEGNVKLNSINQKNLGEVYKNGKRRDI